MDVSKNTTHSTPTIFMKYICHTLFDFKGTKDPDESFIGFYLVTVGLKLLKVMYN